MTDAQREAAIERMGRATRDVDMRDCASAVEYGERMAAAALDALLEHHVVLHHGDVTIEYVTRAGETRHTTKHSKIRPGRKSRLVTRWEPITKEDQ